MILSGRHFLILPILLILFPFVQSCQVEAPADPESVGSEDVSTLPMQQIPMEDLRGFANTGENWSIVGNVQSDYQTDHSMYTTDGTGVLVNLATDDSGDHIFTDVEHGDIELKVEFLVPSGSNSGIYFQGRYEAQILDSWGVENPDFYDVGGIYERWDETQPEGERGFEGSAPRVNAALAPGLWQEYHILFRAPRFDENGNKTANAKFEWVDLNGTRVQENVELTGPTRAPAFENEAETGPLMFQGDHGPVAFRNLRYKKYSQTDSLRLGELEYRVYDYDGDRTPVDFENLTLIEEGTTDSFQPAQLSPKDEHYAMTFSGKLEVPVSGDYLFQTQISNGGNLFINGELVVENTGEFDQPRLGNIVHLTEGTHQLDVTYFQIIWGTRLTIWYEGPDMERRTLASTAPGEGSSPPEPVTVDVQNEKPELIGGFVNYGGEKRTHILSVGHPEKIHYSYDLQRAALLNLWRDPFADLSEMWVGRGHEQLLVPMNATVETKAGIPVTTRNSDYMFDNHNLQQTEGIEEFTLNDLGQPVFRFSYKDVDIEDHIRPSGQYGSFIRSIDFRSASSSDDIIARLAQGRKIELLNNGLYRINGRYYLRILDAGEEDAEILNNGEFEALFVPVLQHSNQTSIQYELIW